MVEDDPYNVNWDPEILADLQANVHRNWFKYIIRYWFIWNYAKYMNIIILYKQVYNK